jgi:hypothetical protein
MKNDELAEQVAELQRRVDALENRRVFEAERVDIVETDGTVRLVISNTARAPDPVCDGQTFQRDGGNPAGLIFYNEEGDECGGLVYRGKRVDEGYAAGAAVLFDQFKQDQVLGIMHEDANGRRRAGLWVWDRRDEPFPATGGATRLFIGKTVDGNASVELRDAEGRVRLRLSVTGDGTAGLEFLDTSGEVTTRLP